MDALIIKWWPIHVSLHSANKFFHIFEKIMCFDISVSQLQLLICICFLVLKQIKMLNFWFCPLNRC